MGESACYHSIEIAMWEKFVESLPIGAKSPFAVLLYICLLFAYVFVVIYTHRLKKVSKSLALVPENQRAALLAKEYSTFPKSGLSPNQWLASRRQLFRFLAFLATLIAGTIILIMSINLSRGPKNPDSVAAAQTPSQQNTVNGSNNNTGNVNQNGDNNTSIIGNHSGNTYTIKSPQPVNIGWLKPSNEPIPKTDCKIDDTTKQTGVIVFFGNQVAWWTPGKAFPLPLVILESRGHNLLTLDRNKQGQLAFSGKIFNSHDDAVVVFEKNRFTISNEAFEVKYPDKSSLMVTVKHLNETALEIHYLNPHTVKISGHFYYKGTEVLVSDDQVSLNNGGWILCGTSSHNNNHAIFSLY